MYGGEERARGFSHGAEDGRVQVFEEVVVMLALAEKHQLVDRKLPMYAVSLFSIKK